MNQSISKSYLIAKRIIDLVISVVFTIISIPMMVLISFAIMLESPGSIIFSQTRVGYKGKTFKIYKFRTMYIDAESRGSVYAPALNLERDPRILISGRFLRKTSLDELPMFFSVIKGDMSLVGPRPAHLFEVEYYTEAEKMRFEVLPGITGYAQITPVVGKYDHKKILELDIEYTQKATLLLDFKILLKTILLSAYGEIRT